MNRPHPAQLSVLGRLLTHWPLLVLVWGLASVCGLLVAATTTVGPVIMRLSRSHGVHEGDVVAFVLFYLVAATVTGWLARSPSHGGRHAVGS